ncbi:ACT domain-containing protein ACR4-like [Malus sylvestris]|uniref:ACT domain-containing protein ACR4-like n=1 Tax=Malus sylvestris TaxID=3752 RepID=UPI0021ACB921|nr:ACT domain-containing protein ACR4-like [Malus sylvestris]
MSFSHDMDDEYEKLIRRMNLPRVVIDNRANKHGILLEVVEVLTDLNLIVTKAYISSDGGWFMDGMNGSQKKEKTATSLTDGINLNIKESFSKCALFLG